MKKYMEEALKEARAAFESDEVPVGAVIVKDGEIIGRGHNMTEMTGDPTAHAEINAIREAVRKTGRPRLEGCSMFVTVEPCSMCAGAVVWARIEKLYFGTPDPKAGACGSLMNIPQDCRLNHFVHIEQGLLCEEARKLMKDFFKALRQKKKTEKNSEEFVL